MSTLLTPLTLRGTTFRNRIWVSPMCQYSAIDGLPDDWHLVHLGARAVGGAGLVLTEATAVTADGRISPQDTGIWNDAQAEQWARIAAFVKQQGAGVGMQLAHAGRKASTQRPWDGRGYVDPADGGWQTVSASPVAYAEWPAPRELGPQDLAALTADWVGAARRADAAGFDTVELHAAHGYLLHQFLSPLTNTRTDSYGGTFENRVRYPLEVISAVRDAWPVDKPLLVRISATDWAQGGWTLEDSIAFSRLMKEAGVDLVDVSSGGLVPEQQIEIGPGYQVPFAAAIREHVPTGAVGMITEPVQAEKVLADGQADVVLLARELLRDPHWPLRAAAELGDEIPWPAQYDRARPR
ncbi:MAG: NADH:flavin oxidoreductase/NADH oxidase [Actinobacteria bacterium]|nr:NADH:flavin oxidoreductase/NADH oxidase [Actinomycetota bacterium]MCA1722132.1 NADH:flavin oxidoreductase/NADH oxidase [Actinomycetota bacterium]